MKHTGRKSKNNQIFWWIMGTEDPEIIGDDTYQKFRQTQILVVEKRRGRSPGES